MSTRKTLLTSLLRVLVQEWGYKAVEAALLQLSDTATRIEAGTAARSETGTPLTTRNRRRLLAIEQVARAQLAEPQLVALRELAARFDRKQFLPSQSDVREFLLMLGEKPGKMEDRSAAFQQLLKALVRLSPERLDKLANSALHSGPSQLGPLSDAISAAAASLHRYREPS